MLRYAHFIYPGTSWASIIKELVNVYIYGTNANFEELLKDYFAQIPQVNDLVKGRVISIGRGEVRVDINGIIIGVVRGEELFSESKEFAHIKIRKLRGRSDCGRR